MHLLRYILLLGSALPLFAQDAPYRTGSWDADSLGNHRVIVSVDSKQSRDAVWTHIRWRRRDDNPELKKLIVVDAATGNEVRNVLPISMNREETDLVFQPTTMPGEYQVYYLPFTGSKTSNYPKISYPKPEWAAEREWLWRNYLAEEDLKLKSWTVLPRARVVAFEAIDSLNSFWPMEVIATRAETAALAAAHPSSTYLVFPEDRRHSIVMPRDLPLRWIETGAGRAFVDTASRREFLSFQLGIFALRGGLDSLSVEFSDLTGDAGGVIDASLFTCFTLGGIDHQQRAFRKNVGVDSASIQPLWCGVQVPHEIPSGKYSGRITVGAAGRERTDIPVTIFIRDNAVAAAGDDAPELLTRLRWLNSRLAADDSVVAPYKPVTLRGNTLGILGRQVTLAPTGLPATIESFFNEEMTGVGTTGRRILAAPIQMAIEDSAGRPMPWHGGSVRFTTQAPGIVRWESRQESGPVAILIQGSLEFDGTMEFTVQLRAADPCSLADVRLRIPMREESARLMMGLGVKGGERPGQFSWKWDVRKNQDGAWLGSVNGGLQFLLKDESYVRPLNTNFYQLKPLVLPRSWANGGRGGITIASDGPDAVLAECSSGPRTMAAGETLQYNFRLTVTPFHTLDTRGQFAGRYYHRFDNPAAIARTGANIVNVHHATPINPYLNYPFFRPAEMKAYADSLHALGMKMKIYYTVRELANRAPELQALRSLGDEIFARGPGGGYAWLQEHLRSGYIAAWFVPALKDAAIINSGVSRWHNFYIEGMAWLVRNTGIDGIYLDDVAFDRTTMKRLRKVLDRGRPGGLIDLHSANQFNERDGFANSANLYLEHFPFINRLWFGEYFDYDAPPPYWMVEVSGIPYGLMGEMLEKGGNPWRGALYGMTNRLPWAGDPRPVWKAWDEFGIRESRMIGYWVSTVPVKTDNGEVLATVYLKKGKALVALASWAKEPCRVRLQFDWKMLAMLPKKTRLTAPQIEGFQSAAEFAVDGEIPVEPGKGWMITLESVQ